MKASYSSSTFNKRRRLNFLPDVLHMEDRKMKVHRSLYVGQHHLHLDDAASYKEDHHRNHILKNANIQYMYHQKLTSVNDYGTYYSKVNY